MQLHDLKPSSSRQTKKRIGRGGKRGKTSGRGHKGQAARAGNSTRPEMREMIKKIPKLRGHGINRAQTVNSEKVAPTVINVAALEAGLETGAAVNVGKSTCDSTVLSIDMRSISLCFFDVDNL